MVNDVTDASVGETQLFVCGPGEWRTPVPGNREREKCGDKAGRVRQRIVRRGTLMEVMLLSPRGLMIATAWVAFTAISAYSIINVIPVHNERGRFQTER